jgi:hypothetical protein
MTIAEDFISFSQVAKMLEIAMPLMGMEKVSLMAFDCECSSSTIEVKPILQLDENRW